MTQLEAARKGLITTEMWRVAQRECVAPEFVRDEVARGRLVIPANRRHLAGSGGAAPANGHHQTYPDAAVGHPGAAADASLWGNQTVAQRWAVIRDQSVLRGERAPRRPDRHRAHLQHDRRAGDRGPELRRHPEGDRAPGGAGRRLLHHPRWRAARAPPAGRPARDRHRLARRLAARQVDDPARQAEPDVRAVRRDQRHHARVRRHLLARRRAPPRLPRRRERRGAAGRPAPAGRARPARARGRAASPTRSPPTRATLLAASRARAPGTTTSRAPAPRSTGPGSSSWPSTARRRARSTTRTSRSTPTSAPCAATTGAACASRRRSRRSRAARTRAFSRSDGRSGARAWARRVASCCASAARRCPSSTGSTPATATTCPTRSGRRRCRRRWRSPEARVPTLGPRDDLVDRAVAPAAPVDDVELAARVEAERAHVERATGEERRGVILPGLRIAAAEAPDEPAAEVRVEVAPAQVGHAAAPVDEAAGDRAAGGVRRLGPGAAVLRRAVAVLEDGQREPRHGAGRKRRVEVRRVEAVAALHDVPAVVETARERGGGHEVDLLE